MQNLLNPWYFTIIRAPKDGQVKARSYIVVMMSQSESFDIVIHILLFMLLGPTYIHIWFIILNKFCLQETQLVFPCSKSSIEISEQFLKSVQSQQQRPKNNVTSRMGLFMKTVKKLSAFNYFCKSSILVVKSLCCCFYCLIWTYSADCSGASIVNLNQ